MELELFSPGSPGGSGKKKNYTSFVYILGTTVLDHNARPAQISLAIHPAAQRSAVRCRTVPCLALRCGAVSCCAVLSFEHTAVPGIRVVVYSYFLFLFI